MVQGIDVVELLVRDHRRAELLLITMDVQPTADLDDYFCTLREELVRHEVAEELIVYPAFRKHVPGGDVIAEVCIAEQAAAERAMAALEKVDVMSDIFRVQLEELRRLVLEHAKHEERDVFPALEENLGTEELGRLGDRYENALVSVPTHPHPHTPDTPPGNKVFGPIAAVADRMRDVMRMRDLADVVHTGAPYDEGELEVASPPYLLFVRSQLRMLSMGQAS